MFSKNDTDYYTLSHNDVNCKEYLPDDLAQFHNINNLSLFHLNCRSLKAHFDEVSDLLANTKVNFSFIGLSEVWLTNDQTDYFSLEGYNSEFCCRQNNSPYGGVALYVNKIIPYKIRNDLILSQDLCENIWIEIPSNFFNS